MPLGARPARVDVTLRVSGFFRDAFPAQIDLFDSAVRAVAALDEPAEPTIRWPPGSPHDRRKLWPPGLDRDGPRGAPGYRVFGSKPGAYGAGLQALIDERGWETRADLARPTSPGAAMPTARNAKRARPSTACSNAASARCEAVVHNQDNREHDLLDSDDYYQFEGGLTAAVRGP